MSMPLAFGMPGHFELLIVLLVILLLFGKRLPGVMGSLGRSIVEFKKGVKGVEEEVDDVRKEVDQKVSGKVERDPARR
jgi:sec-independent protein translocase protein TatA